MTVKMTVDKLASIVALISKLATKEVLVGIPDSKTERTDDAPNNASLGYIHEFGSPIKGIPPRPFLNPGVEKAMPQVLDAFKKATTYALDANEAGAERLLNKAGNVAASSVKNLLAEGDFAPLKYSTIVNRYKKRGAKKMRESESGFKFLVDNGIMDARLAQKAMEIKPLNDTGQLRRSITYVIRGKE